MKALFFVGLTFTLVACAALPAPTAAPKGTPIPSPSRTAKPRRSPTPSPSPTPEPTETSTTSSSAAPKPAEPPATSPSATQKPKPSRTPTVLVPSPSPTPTVPSELDCELIWQSPRNGASFAPGKKFTVGWNVTNNGTAAWDAQSVEFMYLGGAKLHNDELAHLDTTVAPGEDIVLSVAMKAPRNSTKYTTYWGLRRGDTFFCRLTLSIYVRER